MNLLTRTVLEDLIKMEVSLREIVRGNKIEFGVLIDTIEPQPDAIILKVLGLDETYNDFLFKLLNDVYDEKLTVTEVIDQLEQERNLVMFEQKKELLVKFEQERELVR